MTRAPFFFLHLKTEDEFVSPALVSLQIMSNFNKSAKTVSVVWACGKHESMRCSRDYDVVYWILSDLCVSAKCM